MADAVIRQIIVLAIEAIPIDKKKKAELLEKILKK